MYGTNYARFESDKNGGSHEVFATDALSLKREFPPDLIRARDNAIVGGDPAKALQTGIFMAPRRLFMGLFVGRRGFIRRGVVHPQPNLKAMICFRLLLPAAHVKRLRLFMSDLLNRPDDGNTSEVAEKPCAISTQHGDGPDESQRKPMRPLRADICHPTLSAAAMTPGRP